MSDPRLEIFNNSDFTTRVREHFVSISGRCVELGDADNPIKEECYSFSAFVIEIRGVWCLVTAGHVINALEAILKDPKKRITSCGLADYFSVNAKVKKLTPFPFADVHKIHVDQEGIDIAIIPLNDLYRDSLKSNGVVPLPVAQWNGWTPPLCEAYMILGLPTEQIIPIEATETRGPGHNVLLVLVPVEPCEVPHIDGHLNVPKFAGKVLDNENLKSVDTPASPSRVPGCPIAESSLARRSISL